MYICVCDNTYIHIHVCDVISDWYKQFPNRSWDSPTFMDCKHMLVHLLGSWVLPTPPSQSGCGDRESKEREGKGGWKRGGREVHFTFTQKLRCGMNTKGQPAVPSLQPSDSWAGISLSSPAGGWAASGVSPYRAGGAAGSRGPCPPTPTPIPTPIPTHHHRGRPALSQQRAARPAPPCLHVDATGTHCTMTQISSFCPVEPALG